jgi:hypothetical protein
MFGTPYFQNQRELVKTPVIKLVELCEYSIFDYKTLVWFQQDLKLHSPKHEYMETEIAF